MDSITPKNCSVSVKKAIQQLKTAIKYDKDKIFAEITITGLTASTMIGANASKLLESVTIGSSLTYTRPNLNAIQDIQVTASPTWVGLTLSGKVTSGSFASPVDVTNTREYGVELHYSGNNYNVTGIRSRARLKTTDTTATAQGALLQAANENGINAGVLNGALIEAIGKSDANAATIAVMRACLVNTEWGDYDTVTNLKTLHVRTHSRNAAGAGSFGTGYGIYIENEAVGGNGQAWDAGIYFKGTNLSAGNKAFTYGIDFSGSAYGTAEINLSSGGTIGGTQGDLRVIAGKVGVGTDPSQAFDIIGALELEDTTTSITGVIYKGASRFIHNFHHPTGGDAIPDGYNTFIGINAGNFTMGSTATQTYHGSYNLGIGNFTLYYNTTGYYNFAVGPYALFTNNTGYANTAMGISALYANTTGHTNLAFGFAAGRYIADGSTPNETGNTSIFLGSATKAHAAGEVNQIVIGTLTIGAGSNSIVFGNNNIVKTLLKGSIGIGEETDPETLTEWTHTQPWGTWHCSTHSNDDNSGLVKWITKREDGDGTETESFSLEVSHDGAGVNDQLTKVILKVNTGAGLVQALEIGSDLLVTLAGNLIVPNGGTIGQAAGPLLTFNDTTNILGITGIDGVAIGHLDATYPLDVQKNETWLAHFVSEDTSAWLQLTTTTLGVAQSNGMVFGIDSNADCYFINKHAAKFRLLTDNTIRVTIDAVGKTGFGTDVPRTICTLEGTLTLKEQAAADGDTEAYGQLWVKSDSPNTLWFTNDTGTDYSISPKTLTFSTVGPTNGLDVSGLNTLFIDNSSNAVTIGGFANGVDGQILCISLINAGANNVIIEHNKTGATQKIYLHAGADETLNTEYGGWIFVCHGGTDWHDCSHAKHIL